MMGTFCMGRKEGLLLQSSTPYSLCVFPGGYVIAHLNLM